MAEETRNRFSGFSDAIDMEKLEKETQKLFYMGLLLAVSLHAAAASFFMFKKTEVKVVKPPTMELVIRRPRMTKAFEFKKKRQAQRELKKKEIEQRKPSAEIQTKSLSMDIMGSVASFDYGMDMNANVEQEVYVVDNVQIDMASTREPDKQISMKDEMISLDDLDTGQFKAMVIQDPTDKQSIKGFVYISTAWGAQLSPPDSLKRAVINLVEAVNRYTSINAKVDNHLYLDSKKIYDTPFVYITAADAFELTDIERKVFGEYLRNGGFALIDNGTPQFEYGAAEASLRQMLRDALGNDAKFEMIRNDHPVYHCFFDFDGPPQGSEVAQTNVHENTTGLSIDVMGSTMTKQVLYLEGVWLNERLVAIYSDKGYSRKWKDLTDNEPQLKMGVNFVVFALTQAGGISQQKMDFFSSVQ